MSKKTYFAWLNYILNWLYVFAVIGVEMFLYWLFLEAWPGYGFIPDYLHVLVIIAIIAVGFWLLNKPVKQIIQTTKEWVLKVMPKAPIYLQIFIRVSAYVMITLSSLCCLASWFLFYCTFLNRYEFSLESPGWGLVVPVFFAVYSIFLGMLILDRKAGIQSLFGMFFLTLFAWLLLIGFYELFLEFIAPETLKSWLLMEY